ncbi:hypothetical protein [Tardiphaga sp. 862_B3_N1_1]|uniref:hypothetical protein n=1 Tax=Tardiphaga sp. 862_B3_N1_1 TaxID=3240763 RepID=UPI003F8BA41A
MSANKDDEVYFHHNGEPKSGKVLCAGKHGCTVDHGGKQHKLKWEQIAGFKKRAPQRYTVVEEGEDGIIVQTKDGKRRLVSIPPEARAERLEVGKKQRPR